MWEMMGNITSADLILQAEESRRAIRETAEAHQVVIDQLRRENAELKNDLIGWQAAYHGKQAQVNLLVKLHEAGRVSDAFKLTSQKSPSTGQFMTLLKLTYNEARQCKEKEYRKR